MPSNEQHSCGSVWVQYLHGTHRKRPGLWVFVTVVCACSVIPRDRQTRRNDYTEPKSNRSDARSEQSRPYVPHARNGGLMINTNTHTHANTGAHVRARKRRWPVLESTTPGID